MLSSILLWSSLLASEGYSTFKISLWTSETLRLAPGETLGVFVYIYFVSLSSLIVFDSASMLIAYVHCEGSIWAFGAPKSHHDISNTLVRHSPPHVLQYTNSNVSSIGRLRFYAHTTNDMYAMVVSSWLCVFFWVSRTAMRIRDVQFVSWLVLVTLTAELFSSELLLAFMWSLASVIPAREVLTDLSL